jgi:lipopolysaccharide assembly protein A
MKTFQAIVFLVFLLAILAFSAQNTQPITVNFLKWSVTGPIAFLILVVYVLGMLSGWSVVAFVTRSLRRISQPRD